MGFQGAAAGEEAGAPFSHRPNFRAPHPGQSLLPPFLPDPAAVVRQQGSKILPRSSRESPVPEDEGPLAVEGACRRVEWEGGTEREVQSGRYRAGGTERESGRYRAGGTEREVQSGRYRAGGIEREVQSGRYRAGGTEREVQSGRELRESQRYRVSDSGREERDRGQADRQAGGRKGGREGGTEGGRDGGTEGRDGGRRGRTEASSC
eukprot:768391-Hanusia_phi.AAC.3